MNRHNIQKIMPKRKTVVSGDWHVPFHRENAVRELLKELNGADRLIINGDFLDCGELSTFRRYPDSPSFREEIETGRRLLERVRGAFRGRIDFVRGNHEARIALRLLDSVPGLYGSVTVPGLLGLKELGINYRDSRSPDCFITDQGFLVGHFALARAKSGYTAHGLLEKYGKSLAQGHTHRLSMVCRTQFDRTLIGVETGCLCKPQDYAGMADWQTGFAVIEDGKPRLVHLRP